MKIGLVTLQKAYNSFGASLQAYATFNLLSNLGHEVKIIDVARTNSLLFIPSKHYATSNQNNYYKSLPYTFLYILRNFKSYRRFKKFNNRCNYTRYYNKLDWLFKNPPIFDIYITGSDQVWNPTLDTNLDTFLLMFAPKGAKLVSFASSIGLNHMPNEYINLFVKGIRRYQNISVREEKARSIIEELTGRIDVEVVLDPTLLLSRDFWSKIADKPLMDDYVLSFCLNYDKTKMDISHEISRLMNKKLVVIGQKIEGYEDVTFINDAGPEQWLGLMKYSSHIFSDSFHGTAFAINFRKSFTSYISNQEKASRIVGLLDKFGLSTCLYNKQYEFQKPKYDDDFENMMSNEIKHSIAFLESALS